MTISRHFSRSEVAELVEREFGTALRIARNESRGSLRRLRPDFESCALFGLWRAAETYNPVRGVTFPKHARTRIVGEIREEMRRQYPGGFRKSAKSGAPRVGQLGMIHGNVRFPSDLRYDDGRVCETRITSTRKTRAAYQCVICERTIPPRSVIRSVYWRDGDDQEYYAICLPCNAYWPKVVEDGDPIDAESFRAEPPARWHEMRMRYEGHMNGRTR